MSKQSMMLYVGTWGDPEYKTFKMLPIEKDCPFLECIYDADAKILAVIGTFTKQNFTFMQKLDVDGNPKFCSQYKAAITKFGSPEKAAKFLESEGKTIYSKERVATVTVNEYLLSDPKDIEEFIQKFACNKDYFEYQHYMKQEAIELVHPKPTLELTTE